MAKRSLETICGTTSQADRGLAYDKYLYKNSAIGAVAQLIGGKSKGGIRNAEEMLNSAKAKKDYPKIARAKKELKVEQKKYDDHSELTDILIDYTMKAGGLHQVGYDRYIADPSIIANSWRQVFEKNMFPHVDELSVRQGPHRLNSMKKLVLRTIKKRDKFISQQDGKTPSGMTAIQLAWLSPETVASKSDAFGIMHGAVKKILRLTDREIQLKSKFIGQFDDTRKEYKRSLDQLYAKSKAGGSLSDFTLTKGSMWGVKGFNLVIKPKYFKDGKIRNYEGGEDVILYGESIYAGEESVQAQIIGNDGKMLYNGKKVWIPKTDIQKNTKNLDDDIQNSLVALYMDELHNEVSRGQTRFIIPQKFSPAGKAGTDESADVFKVSKLVKQMYDDYEYGKTNDTKRKTANIHTVKIGAWEYTWVMTKPGEKERITKAGYKKGKDVVGEVYNAYLLKKVKTNKNSEETSDAIFYLPMKDTKENREEYRKDMDRIFKNGEGWYRSLDEHNFGRRVFKKTGLEISGSSIREFVDFNWMDNQPSKYALEKSFGGNTTNFNKYLLTTRKIMEEISRDVMSRIKDQAKRSKELRKIIVADFLKKGKSMDEANEWIDKFLLAGGIKSRVWQSGVDEWRTSNMYFNPKIENYWPDMYTNENITKLIDTTIGRIQLYIDEAATKEDLDEDAMNRYKEAEAHMLELSEGHAGLSPETDETQGRLIENEQLVYVKHLSNWTKSEFRRKDGRVPYAYLSKMYSVIAKNDLVNDTLESVYKMSRIEQHISPDAIEYTLNRVKMAMGDSDTRARSALGRETGYAQLANRMNTIIPESIRVGTEGGIEYTAESAERFVKWSTTWLSSRFLGAASAMGNRTQIVNMIIRNGFSDFWESGRLFDEDNDYWNDIVKTTGVQNLLTMFADVMFKDGEPNFTDWGFALGGLAGPLPSKQMLRTLNLLGKSREAFISDRNSSLDLALIKLQMSMDGKQKENIRALRRLEDKRRNPYTKEEQKHIINNKRGDLADLLMIERAENKRKIIEARVKKLIGNVTDSQLKKFVSWKLSFWPSELGKEVFTFTEGEKSLRRQTVMMSMLDAQRRGILPGDQWKSKTTLHDEANIFKSPTAIKIARDAVYNTQFGMTPVYMGEAFNGFGRSVFQFKQYTVQQMAHDYKTLQNFTRGNDDWVKSSIPRLLVATAGAMKRTSTRGYYNPQDTQLDHEALAVVRLIFTRVTASAVAGGISAILPITKLSKIFGTGAGFGAFNYSLIRSAESPLLALPVRLLIWSLMFGMMSDDDDDGKFEQILETVQYLVIPAFLGTVYRDIRDGVSWLSDD